MKAFSLSAAAKDGGEACILEDLRRKREMDEEDEDEGGDVEAGDVDDDDDVVESTTCARVDNFMKGGRSVGLEDPEIGFVWWGQGGLGMEDQDSGRCVLVDDRALSE